MEALRASRNAAGVEHGEKDLKLMNVHLFTSKESVY